MLILMLIGGSIIGSATCRNLLGMIITTILVIIPLGILIILIVSGINY